MLKKLKEQKRINTVWESFRNIRNHIEELHVQKNNLASLLGEKKAQIAELKVYLREFIKEV